jgi:hypothetical protein
MPDPVETPKRLIRKADRGRDEATPVIVLGGVMTIVGAAVAVLVAIALLLYFLI